MYIRSFMSISAVQKELWLREFQLNGFVILRNFLPVELVSQMYDELLPLLESEYAKAVGDGFAQGRARGRLALHIEKYADMFKGALADDRYRRNPVIEELADALLGEGGWERGWTVVEACWRDSMFMGWHSDQKPEATPDVDGHHELIRLTYNIPLVDFNWDNGAMELLPGSHHLPRSFPGVDGLGHLHPHRLALRRGDTLLRDGNILHRGTPNLTDHVRPMLDQTYKKA